MGNLTLNDAFRYLFGGVLFFALLYQARPVQAAAFVDGVGPVGLPLILLVGGTLIYFLYRAFIYESIVVRLQDACRFRSHNYRTYLSAEFGLTRRQAEFMIRSARHDSLSGQYAAMANTAGAIHFLYLGGALVFPFSVVWLVLGDTWLGLAGFAIATLLFVGGFLEDRRYESRELSMLLMLPAENVTALANQVNKSLARTTRKQAPSVTGQDTGG